MFVYYNILQSGQEKFTKSIITIKDLTSSIQPDSLG